MPITDGKVRTSTGLRNPQQPITAIRPVYDDMGVLTACQVELEAQMDDGSSREVTVELLGLLTATERTRWSTILGMAAAKTAGVLA